MLRRVFLAGLFASIPLAAFATGQKRQRTRQPSQRSMRSAQSMIKRAPQTGHLKRKHLGKSVSQLKKRAVQAARNSTKTRKQAKKIKNSAAAQRVLARRSQRKRVRNRYGDFSSFSSQKQMQLALARAMDQNRNKIRKYINSGGKGRISISTQVGKGAGAIYRGATGKLLKPTGVTFSISKEGNRLSVYTGYLTRHKGKR